MTLRFQEKLKQEVNPEAKEDPEPDGKYDPYDKIAGLPKKEMDVESLKTTLPSWPWWQYPLLLLREFFKVVLIWGPPWVLILVTSVIFGPFLGVYLLLSITWDEEAIGWTNVKPRHFDN